MYKTIVDNKIILSESGEIQIDNLDLFLLIENFLSYYNVEETFVLDKIDTNNYNDELYNYLTSSKTNEQLNNFILLSKLDFFVKLNTLIKYCKYKIEKYNCTHFIGSNNKLIKLFTNLESTTKAEDRIYSSLKLDYNKQQYFVFHNEINFEEFSKNINNYKYLVEHLEDKNTEEIIDLLHKTYDLLEDVNYVFVFLRLFYLSYDDRMYQIGFKCLDKIINIYHDKKICEYKNTVMRHYINIFPYLNNKNNLVVNFSEVYDTNTIKINNDFLNFKSIFSMYEKEKGLCLNTFILNETRKFFDITRKSLELNSLEIEETIDYFQNIIDTLFQEKLHDQSKMRLLSVVSAKNLIKAKIALEKKEYSIEIPKKYENEIIKIYEEKSYIADFGTKIKLLTMIAECQMLYNILPLNQYKNIYDFFNKYRKELIDNIVCSEFYSQDDPTLVQSSLFGLALQYSVVFNRKNIYKIGSKNIVNEVYDYIEKFNTYHKNNSIDKIIVKDLYDKELKQIWSKDVFNQ